MTQEEFFLQYMQQLNEQQKEAVYAVDGAVLLLAVPGSGKTTVLVTRLGYMILCRDIPPERILTMTYTKTATIEMNQRFQKLFGQHCQKLINFSTINSLSVQIIQYYARQKGQRWPYRLSENGEDFRIVQQIYQSVNGEFPTDSTVSDTLRGISYIKNRMLSPEDAEKVDVGVDNLAQIWKLYDKAMKAKNLMDFDDQMVYAHEILTRNPEVLAHFQRQYPYICVDESQDTSKIQHTIIKLLTRENLFMVGDEDQSIYGFRAAYPEALLNFENDYPGARVLLMESNYRSSQEIVAASNRFIVRNPNRHPKESKATRGNKGPLRVIRSSDRKIQLDYVLSVAENCREDTAVLFRNNDSAIPLIDLLDRHQLPFYYRGSDDKFFTHKVVVDIVNMLRFSYDLHSGDLFMRFYYKFGGGISKDAAVKACSQSNRTGKNILEELVKIPELSKRGLEIARDLLLMLPEIPKGTADAALRCLWDTLKYGTYVSNKGQDVGKLNILRLLAAQVESPMDLLERMDALRSLVKDTAPAAGCKLTLSTIHSSKGLEYDKVILMDVFDGVLPGITKADAENADDLRLYEEERRLCYVGMTRAKNNLTLFQLQHHPSEFVDEIVSGLPKISCDEQDVFAPLHQNLLGKTYNHKEHGKGTVVAQSDDLLMVEFPQKRVLRMTFAEMLDNQAISYAAATAPAPNGEAKKALNEKAVTRGMRVYHSTFGKGTVVTVAGGTAIIAFGREYGQRTILLKSAIERGLLWG